MSRTSQISVFGVYFSTFKEFLVFMGYKNNISKEVILRRYGSFESFISYRLGTRTTQETEQLFRQRLVVLHRDEPSQTDTTAIEPVYANEVQEQTQNNTETLEYTKVTKTKVLPKVTPVQNDLVFEKVKTIALQDFIFSDVSDKKIQQILDLFSDTRSVADIKKLLLT